jgi:hypothetical protein
VILGTNSRILGAACCFGWILSTGCGRDELPLPRGSAPVEDAGDTPTATARPSALPSASATMVPVTSSAIAAECTTDAECGEGLVCSRADSMDFFGGGAAGGYCTAPCETHDDCMALDTNARCGEFTTGVGSCFLSCTAGESLLSLKCQGRPDLACDDQSFTIPMCRPMCAADAECGADRRCNIAEGVCMADDVVPTPVGTDCALEGGEDECLGGFCLAFSSTSDRGICSGLCTFGASGGCGVANNAQAGGGEPICLFPVADLGSVGDVAFCGQKCDCDTECHSPEMKCLIQLDISPTFGAAGFCYPELDPAELPDGFEYGRACAPSGDADVPDAAMTDAAADDAQVDSATTPADAAGPLRDSSMGPVSDSATDSAPQGDQ